MVQKILQKFHSFLYNHLVGETLDCLLKKCFPYNFYQWFRLKLNKILHCIVYFFRFAIFIVIWDITTVKIGPDKCFTYSINKNFCNFQKILCLFTTVLQCFWKASQAYSKIPRYSWWMESDIILYQKLQRIKRNHLQKTLTLRLLQPTCHCNCYR